MGFSLKKLFKGGGLLGTVLGVASAFIPVLQPVAIAYNSVKAIQSGNPLNIAMAGFGAYNALSGSGGFSGSGADNLDSLSSSSYMGDMGGGGYGGSGSIIDTLSSNTYMGDMGGGNAPSSRFPWERSLDPETYTPTTTNTTTPFSEVTPSITGIDSLTPTWAQSVTSSLTGDLGTGLSKSVNDLGSSGNFKDFTQSTGFTGGAAPNFGNTQSDMFNLSSPTVDTTAIGSTNNPNITPDTYGQAQGMAGTIPSANSLEGLNSGQGITASGNVQGLQPQSYTYENKDFLTGRNGTGMNADVSELAPNFKQGLEMNNIPDIYKKLTTPIGSQQEVQATPLGLGARGLSALYDMQQQNKAQKYYQDQINQQKQWADQNSQRNQFASNEWTKSQSDPMYGYDAFLRGAGGDFLAQARAKAAATGNRGSYLNSGRMQTDLANLWLKNQAQRSQSLAGGFSQSNPYSGTNQLTAGYADMMKNKAAPLGQFANYVSNFDLSKLWS